MSESTSRSQAIITKLCNRHKNAEILASSPLVIAAFDEQFERLEAMLKYSRAEVRLLKQLLENKWTTPL